MKRNFKFEHLTIVRLGDRLIDLHNAYDLTSFGTDRNGSEVKLAFARNSYAIDPSELPSSVTLTCSGNVRVAFNNLDQIAAPLHSEGIDIAYFDEGCDWLSFLDEVTARTQEPQGLHVSFTNGFAARIYCEEVTVFTE